MWDPGFGDVSMGADAAGGYDPEYDTELAGLGAIACSARNSAPLALRPLTLAPGLEPRLLAAHWVERDHS